MRRLRFQVKKNPHFADKIIQVSSAANQNKYRFYRTLRQKWGAPALPLPFDPETDFARQKVHFSQPGEGKTVHTRPKKNSLRERMLRCNGVVHKESAPGEGEAVFRAVDNSQFAFCESYPEAFLVPRPVSNVLLGQVCKFRSKGRVPMLCFALQSSSEGRDARTAFLWRGAQLKSGILNHRSPEDEFFVALMSDQSKFAVD